MQDISELKATYPLTLGHFLSWADESEQVEKLESLSRTVQSNLFNLWMDKFRVLPAETVDIGLGALPDVAMFWDPELVMRTGVQLAICHVGLKHFLDSSSSYVLSILLLQDQRERQCRQLRR